MKKQLLTLVALLSVSLLGAQNLEENLKEKFGHKNEPKQIEEPEKGNTAIILKAATEQVQADSLVYFVYDEGIGDYVRSSKYVRQLDAYGNIVYYEYYRWENNAWVGQTKYVRTFIANGNQTFYSDFIWDYNNNKWVNNYKWEQNFDNYGNYTGYANYNWNGTDWIGNYKYNYAYDENGNLTLYQYSNWDAVANDWRITHKEVYTYNESGQTLTNEYHYWDEGVQALVLEGTYVSVYNPDGTYLTHSFYTPIEGSDVLVFQYNTIVYDANANMISYIGQTKDEVSGNMVNSEKYVFAYDAQDFVTNETRLSWDSNLNDWINVRKTVYEYNIEGKDITTNYNWVDNTWTYTSKIYSSKDEFGNQNYYERYNWDGTNWVGEEKWIRAYDSNGNSLLYENYNWENGSWVGVNNKEVYDYDDNGNRTVYERYIWDIDISDWWMDYYKYDTFSMEGYSIMSQGSDSYWNGIEYIYYEYRFDNVYDDFGNKISRIYSTYDTELESWVESNRIEYSYTFLPGGEISLEMTSVSYDQGSTWSPHTKMVYYYPQALSVNNNMAEDAISLNVYPNPATEYITVSLENWDYTPMSSLTIYNLAGNVVTQVALTQNNQVVPVTKLPKGQYIVKLTGANSSVTKFSIK